MRARRAALTLAAVLALQGLATAQPVPVVFVHGIFSNGDNWRQTSARLANVLQIEPHVVDLASTDYLENQAARVQALKGGLPTSTIAVAHSQGGLIARHWSRQKALRGVLTLGTPHAGAPLSRNALDALHFNHVLYNLIGLASTWGAGTEHGWIAAALSSYFTTGLQLSSGTIQRLLTQVAITNYVPVAPQLAPGSGFLLSLNAPGNLQREAIGIPYRVGLNYVADDYWRGGVAVGLAPDQREWVWAAMVVLPPTLEYAAAYVDMHYSNGFTFAAQLRNIAGYVRDLDPMWCWAVTNDRGCRVPHDGIVPTAHQVYPGGVNYQVIGPSHVQESERSDREITNVLAGVMGVPRRGVTGGGGGGATTVHGGTRLYADQQFRSPNGTVLRYQSDGNLVLYDSRGAPMWASSTEGFSAGYVEMQPDGNLVLYDGGGTPRWASDTYAPGGRLIVHDSGYAAIHDAANNVVWWTN